MVLSYVRVHGKDGGWRLGKGMGGLGRGGGEGGTRGRDCITFGVGAGVGGHVSRWDALLTKKNMTYSCEF